jgi:hypothetical protein
MLPKDVKVGDVVRVLDLGRGVVKYIDPRGGRADVAVELDESNEYFHDCDGHCKDKRGYWLYASDLALIAREEDVAKSNEHDGTSDQQNYYKNAARQPIEFMQELMTPEAFDGFLLGNILKYRLRAGFKDDANKDIEKAAQYAYWRELAQKGVMINPERDVVPSGFTYEVV